MAAKRRKMPLRLPQMGPSVTDMLKYQQSKSTESSRVGPKISLFNVESQFYPFGRKVLVPLTAEFVGLFFLTFIGASQQVSFASPKGGANETFSSVDLDALAGRSASPVVVGITLALLINSLVHLSGANLNPTASIAFLTIGDLPWQLFFPYIVVQILGSTLGAAFVRALMPAEKYLMGGGGMLLTNGDLAKAFGVEVVICFFMMFVAFTSSVDQPSNAVFAYTIGFTVTVSLYAFGPITGACMNPSRSIGAILAAYGFDFGPETSKLFADAWTSTGVYFAGDLLGGFIAGVAYKLIAKNQSYAFKWTQIRERFCSGENGDEGA